MTLPPAGADWLVALRAPPTVTLSLEYVAEDPLRLPPFWGSMLHGAIGHGLLSLGVPDDGGPYVRLTAPPAFALHASAWVRASGQPPLVLAPPPPSRKPIDLRAGSPLRFEIVLVGSALDDAGNVLDALVAAGRGGFGAGRGRASLVAADCRGLRVWRSGKLLCAPTPDPSPAPPPVDAFRLETRTPLRLQREGELTNRPTLPDLVAAALRRLYVLRTAATGIEPAVRLDEIAREAHAVPARATWQRFDESRYSSRQDKRHEMDGVLGALEVRASGAPWLALLAEAQRVGIGKGTGFGFGRYDVMAS